MARKPLPNTWKGPLIEYIDENLDAILVRQLYSEPETHEGIREDVKKSILEIIAHPDTEKAYRVLTSIFSNEEERFANMLIACAAHRHVGLTEWKKHPLDRSLLRDNRKLAQSASDSAIVLRRLLEKTLAGTTSSSTCTLWTYHELICQKAGRTPEPCGMELFDRHILSALRVIADFCSLYATQKKTRRPDFNRLNLVAYLDKHISPPAGGWPKIRTAKSDPIFEAIGHLVRATFGIKREGAWSMTTTKKIIERLRRKDGHARE